jgi:hypothetical protein
MAPACKRSNQFMESRRLRDLTNIMRSSFTSKIMKTTNSYLSFIEIENVVRRAIQSIDTETSWTVQ